MSGTAASSEALQAACAGPQLQPVLKHASRVGQLARADTAMKPVACFSASDAVQSQRVPGSNAERCRTNSAAAAAATKQSSDAQQHPANAYLCPAKATKPRKAAATTAKRQQQQQQASLSAASVHFDCQQLKLLPGDVPLHSECMARMQRNSAEPSQTSRYIQRARLTDEMAQASGEDSAVTGATLAGKTFGLASVAWPTIAAIHFQLNRTSWLLRRLCASTTVCSASWSRSAGRCVSRGR